MTLGEIMFIGWNLLMILIIIGYLVWARDNGMFKNWEKPKYDMLNETEPLPWPGREQKPKTSHQKKESIGGEAGEQ